MTTWPSASKATTTHTDSGSDKPRLARVDINQNIINTNDIIDYFDGGGTITVTGDQISFNKGYKETINTLTSATTITVDADVASIHKVYLEHNATFRLTNCQAGQTVVLVITQDSGGNNTGSFELDNSTAAKFVGAQNTLTVNANAIDVVTLFNDGTNLLGSIVADFR